MYFSDRITLRTVTHSTDTDGYPTESNEDTEVWANVKSASRAEFYSANANNLDVTIAFDVHKEDWNDATQVVYNDNVYDIVRSYAVGLGVVELNCSDRGVDNG